MLTEIQTAKPLAVWTDKYPSENEPGAGLTVERVSLALRPALFVALKRESGSIVVDEAAAPTLDFRLGQKAFVLADGRWGYAP